MDSKIIDITINRGKKIGAKRIVTETLRIRANDFNIVPKMIEVILVNNIKYDDIISIILD
jgi:hypothetical protein